MKLPYNMATISCPRHHYTGYQMKMQDLEEGGKMCSNSLSEILKKKKN